MVTIPIRNETTSKVKMPLSSPNLLSLAPAEEAKVMLP